MAAGVVSSTYGHALFELAVEQNTIDELLAEAETVQTVLSENPDYQKLLEHPRIDREEKIILLESCFRGRISDDMTGFLCVLVRNDRQKEIISSLKDFIPPTRQIRAAYSALLNYVCDLNDDIIGQTIEQCLAVTPAGLKKTVTSFFESAPPCNDCVVGPEKAIAPLEMTRLEI